MVTPYSTAESAASSVVHMIVAPDELIVDAATEEITGGVVSTAAAPVPDTDREAAPAFELNATLFAKLPATVGLNRTTTVWLDPAARPNEPPETTLNGAAMDAVPLRVPPPMFVTVKGRSTDPPIVTGPKSTVVWGATERAGGVGGGGSIPLIAPGVAARTASISAPRSLPSVPAFL